jgi:hypothetical protein
MEQAKKKAHDAIGAIAGEGLDWLGRPELERMIAIEFAKKIPLPGDQGITETVHALRILGILICLQLGIDIVTDCPCFLPLAKEKTGEELKACLERKLNALSEHRRA